MTPGTATDDATLLARYAAGRSEADFRALVERHLTAVYSACLRRLGGNAADAEEATQAVFVALARQAPRLRIRGRAGLLGWLLGVARHVSLNRIRERERRSRHEREAAVMRTNDRTERLWEEARSLLDELVDRLPGPQRKAIQMHFLGGLTQREAAAALGVGESTFQMRVRAGLVRLRDLFRRRGLLFTLPILTACLAGKALAAAPPGLAVSACAAASGAAASAAVPALAQKALQAIFWTKVKMAGIATTGAAAALAGAAALGAALSAPPPPPPAADIPLPPPVEWAAPREAPPPPGDPWAPRFAAEKPIPPGAPAVAAWSSNVVKPDETFVLTGERLMEREGAEAVVWLLAASPRGGEARRCRVFSASPRVLMAAVPPEVSFGTYFVWVQNSAGPGAPVPLNRAAPLWIGPMGNRVLPGETRRVFGKNLSRDHGLKESHVYLQPAAGGPWTKLETGEVNPYAVAFRVPKGQAPGTYKLWVHNGHGGAYGFGGPVELVVEASRWTRDPGEIAVRPSGGGDDAPPIQQAIDTQASRPNGGTVRLAAGTFTVRSQINLKGKVRLAGAGRDKTTIRVAHAAPQGGAVHLHGDHLALEDLTLHFAAEGKPPHYGPVKSAWPYVHKDVRLAGLRVSGDPGTRAEGLELRVDPGEITSCEFHRHIHVSGRDAWVHHNVFFGGPYERCEGGFEATAHAVVYERNHTETRDWPKGPGGSRNYMDFLKGKELGERIWAKRVVSNGAGHGSSEFGYYAFNTSKDVAVEDNKGEMYLFHGGETNWYAQVASASGTSLSIRTDGLVGGQAVRVGAGDKTYPPATKVPTEVAWGRVDGEAFVVIVAGTGLGQARRVVSHTEDTIGVESPWRVLPAADSVVTLCFLYKDIVLYRNEMNAFPEGYLAGYSASNAMQFDGNSFGCVAEGNVSARTTSAARIGGTMTGPSFWTEVRGHEAKGCFSGGFLFDGWAWGKTQVLGPWVLGCAFRDSRVEVSPTPPPRGGFHAAQVQANLPRPDGPDGEIVTACVAEGIQGRGGRHGVSLADWTQGLLRRNRLEGFAAGPTSFGKKARPVLADR